MPSILTDPRAGFLMLSLVLLPLLNAPIQIKQRPLDTPRIASVEVVQVVELPVNLQDAVLSETKKGFVLKFVLSNNSDSRIFGIDYLLLVIDSGNTTRAIIGGNEDLKLEPNASKSLVSKRPLQLEVSEGYHLFLIPQRVFSTDSFWEVLNAKKVLEKYALGDYSLKPEVTRATNFVDTPIGGKPPR